MLRMLFGLSLAACAVSSPDLIDAVDPPPPSAEVPSGVFAQLHDEGPEVPGFPAVERTQRADVTRCGGAASEVRITGFILAAEQPLADLLQLSFPTQLDFSDANRETSLRRFEVFTEDLRGRGTVARDHYVTRFDAATAPADKLAAAARLVQVHRHLAALLVRAEIPLDVRTGEQIEAYCGNLAAVATPFLAQADEAVRTCLSLATGAPGWWTDVCVP